MRNAIILLAAMLLPTLAQSQQLKTGNKVLDQAFACAVWALDTNTHHGIIHAGAGYGGEWTRDCAINCWNAASMLRPEAAELSLWSVTENGKRIGHQYWDKILWVPAAWNHYLLTGNRTFLAKAYDCSRLTMKELEEDCYEREYGLFMGPAVFQDGIAAYEAPIYDSAKWDDSYVLHHRYSLTIKCLSTNIAYHIAYRTLAEMARELGDTTAHSYMARSDTLQAKIRHHYYHPEANRLDYLIDHRGVHHPHQEGLGVALALLDNILTPDESQRLVQNLWISSHGIPCIYPSFARNTPDRPGRHNMMIWPHVNMLYAAGCAHSHIDEPFYAEMQSLAALVMQAPGGNFYEIYTLDGKPSGGWQCGSLWDEKPHQTWCATGYINLFLRYVFGLKPSKAGLEISPMGLPDVKKCQLTGLRYRNAELNITIKGSGQHIKRFRINGKESKLLIPADISGKADIVIEKEN